MGLKPLHTIKHGQKVVELLASGPFFFVNDIQRLTGLDPKSLKNVLASLLKNGYVQKNDKGQWFIPL